MRKETPRGLRSAIHLVLPNLLLLPLPCRCPPDAGAGADQSDRYAPLLLDLPLRGNPRCCLRPLEEEDKLSRLLPQRSDLAMRAHFQEPLALRRRTGHWNFALVCVHLRNQTGPESVDDFPTSNTPQRCSPRNPPQSAEPRSSFQRVRRHRGLSKRADWGGTSGRFLRGSARRGKDRDCDRRGSSPRRCAALPRS